MCPRPLDFFLSFIHLFLLVDQYRADLQGWRAGSAVRALELVPDEVPSTRMAAHSHVSFPRTITFPAQAQAPQQCRRPRRQDGHTCSKHLRPGRLISQRECRFLHFLSLKLWISKVSCVGLSYQSVNRNKK